MDEQAFEEAPGGAPVAEVVGNPFMALMEPPIARVPSSTGITVVRSGKALRPRKRRHASQRDAAPQDVADTMEDESAEEQERRERILAYYRARYQRRKSDPAEQARRREWAERNKAKRQAYQREWRRRNLAKSRAYQAAWQRRKLKSAPEKAQSHREAQRAYYMANRERILAKKKAQRAQARRLVGQEGAR